MDALLEQAVQGMKKNGFEVVEVRLLPRRATICWLISTQKSR